MKTIYTSFITDQDKYDKVIDIDLSGLTNYDGLTGSFYGTVSVEEQHGWFHYTGEHGSSDFVDEWGFELAITEL